MSIAPPVRFPVRIIPALAGALLITLAVFLFMQSLIERGQQEEVRLAVYEDVQILRSEPEEEKPEQQQDAPEAPVDEPVIEALDRCWETLAECFEPQELLMKQEMIDKYYKKIDEGLE